MELLLCKNIKKLGIVGDIVNVSAGYARNYLLPQGLATEPTEVNKRALVEARKAAELEHERERAELVALAGRLNEAEITIAARANETGVLYGSVGQREIVAALAEDGYYVHEEQVALAHPIRQLDNTEVVIKLGEDLSTTIKVWVVRDKTGDPEDQEGDGLGAEAEPTAGTEAGLDDDLTDK